MDEQQLQIKPKPFLLWAIVIFAVCCAALLTFFRMGYAILPKVTGAVELCLWLVCLAMWLVHCRERMSEKGAAERDSAIPGDPGRRSAP